MYGLKHQKEKRSMDHFAGLDVSVKETSVCIVDDTGRIAREMKVASEPEALLQVLKNPTYRFQRIGLEAGRCRNGCSVRWPKQACRPGSNVAIFRAAHSLLPVHSRFRPQHRANEEDDDRRMHQL